MRERFFREVRENESHPDARCGPHKPAAKRQFGLLAMPPLPCFGVAVWPFFGVV